MVLRVSPSRLGGFYIFTEGCPPGVHLGEPLMPVRVSHVPQAPDDPFDRDRGPSSFASCLLSPSMGVSDPIGAHSRIPPSMSSALKFVINEIYHQGRRVSQ